MSTLESAAFGRKAPAPRRGPPRTTWTLVANRSGARIFDDAEGYHRLIDVLSPLQTHLEHQRACSHESYGPPDPAGVWPAVANDQHPRMSSAPVFALRIAAHVERNCQRAGVDRLVLVAEPHFLGLLRMWLSTAAEKLVSRSIPRDFADITDAELPTRLEGAERAMSRLQVRAAE